MTESIDRSILSIPEEWGAQGIALRPETSDDGPFLLRLFTSVRTAEFAALGWDEAALQGFLATQMQFQSRHYATAYPNAARQVITRDGQPIGRMILNAAPDSIRLVDITLLPENRQGGLGTALLRALQDGAAARRSMACLSVAFGNPARRLYDRLGFVEVADNGASTEMNWHPPSEP